ncbi:hypothetical protein [Alloscardovia criceti]|uniref:hypothetical protein n=1 Tax=Alloscardovia criceti TaxID=356828 RepID=UPI000373005E|nr:hypothetical protein [Alloscardovia criceti]
MSQDFTQDFAQKGTHNNASTSPTGPILAVPPQQENEESAQFASIQYNPVVHAHSEQDTYAPYSQEYSQGNASYSQGYYGYDQGLESDDPQHKHASDDESRYAVPQSAYATSSSSSPHSPRHPHIPQRRAIPSHSSFSFTSALTTICYVMSMLVLLFAWSRGLW